MKAYKRVIHSDLLNRVAHADVFEIGIAPSFLFVLFGGSGVAKEEYERRSKSIIPIFGSLLEWLAEQSLNLVMVYVSAPYDVPFNRFSAKASSVARWNAHITTELLEPWSQLPYFVSGFSGGTALALNGFQEDPRCFGAGALGADAIPPDFVCPENWAEKLQFYSAQYDRVCNLPANRSVITTLVIRVEAEEVLLPSRGHSLAEYSGTDGLGELILFANRLFLNGID